jgi:hypothetical protein
MDEALMVFFPGHRIEPRERALLGAKWKEFVPRIRGTPHECTRRAARRFLRMELPRVLRSSQAKITTQTAERLARIKVQLATLVAMTVRAGVRCQKFHEAAQALVSSSSSEGDDDAFDLLGDREDELKSSENDGSM